MKREFAYLLKKFPRLSETFILNEMLGQEANGRDLHVFSRRAPDDEPRHPQLADLRATVEVLPSSRSIDPWSALFGLGDEVEDVFTRVGRIVREAAEWEHPRFPGLLNEAIHLYGRTRELGIRHVHTHFATDSAIVAMLLHRLGGPTYSVTAHAKDIYRNTVRPSLLNKVFGEAEFVVTVCDSNKRYLDEALNERAATRVRRLYNGIDLSLFEPDALDGEEAREPDHVLAVGRLVEKKGFDVLIEAFTLAKAKRNDLRLTIVGEGEDRPRLEQLIRRLGLEQAVNLAGAEDQDAVRNRMGRATLMCLPCVVGSDGNRDALPTVLLEALAVGLPCISTPVTGIPEILDEGRAGVLVPERDPQATAAALVSLLDDHERRRQFSRLGRIRAQELFDRDAISSTLHGWFEDVLQKDEERCESPA